MHDTNDRRGIRPGSPFVVPAFVHFGCEIPDTMWQPRAIMFKATPDADCPRTTAIQHDKPRTRAFATLVFEYPVQAWNAALLNHYRRVCPHQMRARLFAEEEALHALVYEQHVAWMLYWLAHACGNDEPETEALRALARRAGLHDARTLNGTCVGPFGVELAALLAGNVDSVSGLVHGSIAPLERRAQPLAMAL